MSVGSGVNQDTHWLTVRPCDKKTGRRHFERVTDREQPRYRTNKNTLNKWLTRKKTKRQLNYLVMSSRISGVGLLNKFVWIQISHRWLWIPRRTRAAVSCVCFTQPSKPDAQTTWTRTEVTTRSGSLLGHEGQPDDAEPRVEARRTFPSEYVQRAHESQRHGTHRPASRASTSIQSIDGHPEHPELCAFLRKWETWGETQLTSGYQYKLKK